MKKKTLSKQISTSDLGVEFNVKAIDTIECTNTIDFTKWFIDDIGIIILESNKFSLYINEETIIPNDNMIIIIGETSKIKITPLDQSHPQIIHILSVGYGNSTKERLLKKKYYLYQPLNVLPYIEKCNEIQRNFSCSDFTSKIYIKKTLYELIFDIINEYRSLSECSDMYSKIKAYIDSHYTDTDGFSIQILSDLFGISYNTLERKFKNNLGISPHQYITELRMKKACEYLKETTLNIETIALALGYQDKYYFSRAFKSNQKRTPSEYRAEYSTLPQKTIKPQIKSSEIRNIVISNYNRITVYRIKPKRIVCLSYFAVEVCIALGLSDNIIGMVETEGALEDCKSEYRDIIKKIHKIPKNRKPMPDFDVIDSMMPDFVYGASCSFLEQCGIADANEFEKHGMNIYVSKATYSTLSTMHDVYEDIYSIGKIFDKTEQARLIVKDMQCELQIIKEKLSEIEPKRVFLYTAEVDDKVLTVGMGLESYLLKIAKGINVFENYPQQRILRDWADVVKENPEIIIIHGSSVNDTDMIINKIKNNDFLKNISAVMNDHIYSIRVEHTFPGLHNIDVIKQFAFYLHGCILDENIQQS